MLIDQLILFLAEAGQSPFLLWQHNYRMVRKSFLFEIKQIESTIDSTSGPAQILRSLTVLLEQERPNERKLAEGFVEIETIFSTSGVADPRIAQYQLLAAAFLQRVKKDTALAATRTQMKHSLPVAEQDAFDNRLFAKEGFSYCLMYYVAYYKKLTDYTTPDEKRAFITQAHINLGFGELPGLREDFLNDEVLEKFIVRILNDAARTALTREYYFCKQSVLQATDYVQVEASLYELIHALLVAFQQHGVTAASDYFFEPYGKEATIAQLIAQFTPDYAPAR